MLNYTSKRCWNFAWHFKKFYNIKVTISWIWNNTQVLVNNFLLLAPNSFLQLLTFITCSFNQLEKLSAEFSINDSCETLLNQKEIKCYNCFFLANRNILTSRYCVFDFELYFIANQLFSQNISCFKCKRFFRLVLITTSRSTDVCKKNLFFPSFFPISLFDC